MAIIPSTLGEFGRIERFFRPLTRNFPGALELSDDAAVVSVPTGQELVVTTDAIVAGVHFLASDPARDIARKALRVNLSDLAAKGAHPLAYTLTLATGRELDDSWVEAFAAGLADDQLQYGIALAGGDSVSTAGPIWASITAFGLAEAGRMVRRSGARPGDVVLVTGTIGDAALGLAVAQGRLAVEDADKVTLLDRYRLPQPRTHLARAIAEYANAAIDISDGLAADFGHLCRASGASGSIAVPNIPLSSAARNVLAADGTRMSDILTGGDDYEVLLTASAQSASALQMAAAARGIALTEVGSITSAENTNSAGQTTFIDGAGRKMTIDRTGWTHS
ncbi:MAG: thiL [Rhodospirillales bacterium]|nr:thiL [Rhodospirillales bacterium]